MCMKKGMKPQLGTASYSPREMCLEKELRGAALLICKGLYQSEEISWLKETCVRHCIQALVLKSVSRHSLFPRSVHFGWILILFGGKGGIISSRSSELQ